VETLDAAFAQVEQHAAEQLAELEGVEMGGQVDQRSADRGQVREAGGW
jgi:hypothetical protein